MAEVGEGGAGGTGGTGEGVLLLQEMTGARKEPPKAGRRVALVGKGLPPSHSDRLRDNGTAERDRGTVASLRVVRESPQLIHQVTDSSFS